MEPAGEFCSAVVVSLTCTSWNAAQLKLSLILPPMEISLNNYPSVLSRTLLGQAAKCTVRECDQPEKGLFVAYVDENEISFDVSITIAPDQKVMAHSCDCPKGAGFCRHKAALLVHIANEKKPAKVSVKAKKKQRDSELLLQDAEPAELKLWVRELLSKHRDLEMAFIHHFSGQNQSLSPEDVVRITNDAIKAVVRNKRNIDATLVKKLVDLWTEVHAPTVKNYLLNVADPAAFTNFGTVMNACMKYYREISVSSNRIPRYLESLLKKTYEPLMNLATEEAWIRATGYLIEQTDPGRTFTWLIYLNYLAELADSCSPERKKDLAERLAVKFSKFEQDSLSDNAKFAGILLDMVVANGLFSRYYNLFHPYYFENEFNIRLIKLLISHDQYAIAGEFCKEQIGNNLRDEFNWPYLGLLREIYTRNSDGQNLSRILEAMLINTFNYDDYLFVYDHKENEEEKKRFRSTIFSRARQVMSYNHLATEFVFQLSSQEKSFKKMIGYIASGTSYSLIVKYLEPMILADKNGFLRALFTKNDFNDWHASDEEDTGMGSLQEIKEKLLKFLTPDQLKEVIDRYKPAKHYESNRLINYLSSEFDSKVFK